VDSDNVSHGFARDPDGGFKTFDVPVAATGPGRGTIAISSNPQGTITGWYLDENGVSHGFVRYERGDYSYFDVPGTGLGPGQGTQPLSINATGEITGMYIDQNNVTHGFVLRAENPSYNSLRPLFRGGLNSNP